MSRPRSRYAEQRHGQANAAQRCVSGVTLSRRCSACREQRFFENDAAQRVMSRVAVSRRCSACREQRSAKRNPAQGTLSSVAKSKPRSGGAEQGRTGYFGPFAPNGFDRLRFTYTAHFSEAQGFSVSVGSFQAFSRCPMGHGPRDSVTPLIAKCNL